MLTRRQFARLAALSPFASSAAWSAAWEPVGRLGGGDREVTILYTNDFHSAFDPVPAFWLPGSPRLGGAVHLATLIERERAAAPGAFLFDAGDMFTGTLSLLTRGEALLEMMLALRYDAMGLGNHEFDYGWRSFDDVRQHAPFPLLCCNVRYRTGGARFRPCTIVERDGVRLGVIGVMGLRAARQTIMPSNVAELEFTDPVEEATACVRALRPSVDAVVVLGHQGLPGPMQSDAENDPEVQRPVDEDIAFCDAVPGIALYIAAHSHRGLEEPIVTPRHGTILTQTFGYGTRLGRVRLQLSGRRVIKHEARLLKVWSDELPAHPGVARRLAHFRSAVAGEIGPPIARAAHRLTRKYNRESPLGSFVTDVLRARTGADVALTNAGGLRADLPAGELTRAHILDAFPFLDFAVTLELAGRDLKAVLEQGLTLQSGLLQASGLRAVYDLQRPAGSRLLEVAIGGNPLEDGRAYRVTTNGFLAQGGDNYRAFLAGRELARGGAIRDLLVEQVKAAGVISLPEPGRWVPRA
jgi:2',3'-cyclic-nucleotide 2'-phosphodiesterase (5'-nucleotidase family)